MVPIFFGERKGKMPQDVSSDSSYTFWSQMKPAFLRKCLQGDFRYYLTPKEQKILECTGNLPSDLVIHFKRPLWADGRLSSTNLVIISREQAREIAKKWSPLEEKAAKGIPVFCSDFVPGDVSVAISSKYRNSLYLMNKNISAESAKVCVR